MLTGSAGIDKESKREYTQRAREPPLIAHVPPCGFGGALYGSSVMSRLTR